MPLYLGNNAIDDLKLGNDQIKEVYAGSDLIWRKTAEKMPWEDDPYYVPIENISMEEPSNVTLYPYQDSCIKRTLNASDFSYFDIPFFNRNSFKGDKISNLSGGYNNRGRGYLFEIELNQEITRDIPILLLVRTDAETVQKFFTSFIIEKKSTQKRICIQLPTVSSTSGSIKIDVVTYLEKIQQDELSGLSFTLSSKILYTEDYS